MESGANFRGEPSILMDTLEVPMHRFLAVVIVPMVLGGCASSGGGMEENAVVHAGTAADLEATRSVEPIREESATLWVNGLGCPQCSSNIDAQFARVRGVDEARVDLGTGTVTLALSGKERPSPRRLSEAVLDAGFTLVKIEAPAVVVAAPAPSAGEAGVQ